jgi:hypothetical protein
MGRADKVAEFGSLKQPLEERPNRLFLCVNWESWSAPFGHTGRGATRLHLCKNQNGQGKAGKGRRFVRAAVFMSGGRQPDTAPRPARKPR